MKLYTEFEIKFAMDIARCQPDKTFDEVLEELTPIELPSDEEILHQSDEFELNSRESLGMHLSFEIGAKWMRDKIGGNNEQ